MHITTVATYVARYRVCINMYTPAYIRSYIVTYVRTNLVHDNNIGSELQQIFDSFGYLLQFWYSDLIWYWFTWNLCYVCVVKITLFAAFLVQVNLYFEYYTYDTYNNSCLVQLIMIILSKFC